MHHTNYCSKSLARVALIAVGALPLYPQEITLASSPTQFGMIGLAAGQTLRLSVVAFPPTPVAPPCIAQLSFANSAGGAVGPGKVVNLNPGQGDFLDLNANALVSQFGQRAEIRPVVTLLPSPAGGPSACQAASELFDNFSGFSLLLVPGTTAFPPAPIFGLQGVALGQLLRLNVVALPTNPCMAQLSFVDKQGNPAGPAPKTVNLSAGQADHLDVSGASLVAQFGQRAEVRPAVAMLPGAAASGCAATAETYDPFAGRTWAWIPPGPSE